METFSLHHHKGIWNGTFSHFDRFRLLHGISSRLGGISSAPFSSLNLALHTGDNDTDVLKNREAYCQAVGIPADRLITAEQVHGEHIALVTQRETGKGAKSYAQALKQTDALITQTPGVPLMLFFADCVPVLIFDPVTQSIGIVHAGWKGTVALIAQKTVLAMQDAFGTEPANCLVGIAPSIGPCCYEIDNTVLERVKQNFAVWPLLTKPSNDRWKLNLWEANRSQLIDIGVQNTNIVCSDICTACNKTLFFSYRAENGKTGRIGAFIMLT
ncbi:hypothetical protein P22_0342 [Propionispora sp. 2/2-37]|uniref:peptidoglycan editing factor PgeF n=1 Tax=Propionispora sp. 2/2-37 TaxID=1677858 RepID=UPI0006BB5B5C|nr:peptidoglycan editing factor PgeF [Propionispora sp. 2/2-37]CUH94276.1 hypothetical protein P22_0342 [Propionispora sp. 2/2-37]